MSAIYLYPSTSYQSPSPYSTMPWEQDANWTSSSLVRSGLDPLDYAIRNAQLEADARRKAAVRARARAQAEAEAQAYVRQQYYLQRKQQERERLLHLQAEEHRQRIQQEKVRLANAIARQIAQAQYEAEREQRVRYLKARQQHAAELEYQQRVEASKRLQAQWLARKAEEQKAREIQRQNANLEDTFLPQAFQHFLGPFLGSLKNLDDPQSEPEATNAKSLPGQSHAGDASTQNEAPSSERKEGKQKEVAQDAPATATGPTSESLEDFLPHILQHFVAPFLGGFAKAEQAAEAGKSVCQGNKAIPSTPTGETAEGGNAPPTSVTPSPAQSKDEEVEEVAVQLDTQATTPSQAQPSVCEEQTVEQSVKSPSAPSPARSVPVGSTTTPASISDKRAPSPTPSNKSHQSTSTEDSRGRSRSPKRARVSDVDENGNEVEKVEEE